MALAKSDGTTAIAVWAEPPLWDEATKSDVAAPANTVKVTLDGAHAVSVYDPLAGTTPIATYASTAAVQLAVTDHPLIVQVGAAMAAKPAGSVGSGSDALVLAISEDAYRGHAQYTVSVDGKQIGGRLTALASHAAGQADTLTIHGTWGPGPHDLAVDFLNDAYAGTSSTDRNLYVGGLTFDGKAVADGTSALLSAGDHHFSFHR